MPTFYYKSIDGLKHITQGRISAKTTDEVAASLAKQGQMVLVVKSEDDRFLIKGSIPPIEKITFCRYMSIMMSTGLSMTEGVETLKNETKNPLMYKILGDIVYNLEQGKQLSDIFERYPGVFESYFLTLVKAGEMSGKLADVFKYLEEELRSEYALNSKVKGALLYPAIVFTAMIGIGIMMFFFVLPQIGRVFLSLNMPLPAFTKGLFTVSISLSKMVIPFIASFLAVFILFLILFRNRKFRNFLSLFVRPFPIIRNLIKKVDLARFCRIFSTLIRSAVPITDALEISLNTLSWYEFKACSATFPEEIKKGKALSTLIKENNIYPSLLVQMVAAGEKTGSLDATLADLASFYEQEVEEEVKSLTQIIEPVLMLLVGVAVGGMILSIIAPIYSVVGNFQQAAGSPGGLR